MPAREWRLRRQARYGVEDHFDDRLWRGDQWRMVDLLRADARAHALRHEPLGVGVDHPVFLGEEVPGRLYFPSGSWSLLLDARDGDWPLCCGEKCGPFGRCMVG